MKAGSLLHSAMRLCGVILLSWLFLAGSVHAQGLDRLLGDTGALSGRAVQLLLLVTVFSLAPAIAIMLTAFPFIVIVLSILRQAIGLQQSPPNILLVSLALFLTYFVMDPVFQAAWEDGLKPLVGGEMLVGEALTAAFEPFRIFMEGRVRPGVLAAFVEIKNDQSMTQSDVADQVAVIVPSFLLSEISNAFEIGFLIFLPFLIIDLVVAAILMSMGMMMVPPAIVSLPFKLAFFVIVDGWVLLSSALVRGYT